MFTRLKSLLERWLAAATRRTLARERPFIVAVTGSVGKSSTRQAITALLQAFDATGRVRASLKNYNNELGLPLTIFQKMAPGRSPLRWLELLLTAWRCARGWQKTGVRTWVLEMGADKPGDIAYLTSIAQPDIGVVTGVTPEDASLPPVHLAKYPSLNALVEEKGTLARQTKTSGTVVLNADDPRVFAMRHHTRAHILTYGETDAADVRILSSCVRSESRAWGLEPVGLDLSLRVYHRRQDYFIPGVFGRGLIYAWAAAMAVAEAMDIPAEIFDGACARFQPLPGRTRILAGKNQVTFFDDSYNAAPAAMLAGLRDLGATSLASGQRRLAVIGEMREIGTEAEQTHRRMGAEAARLGLDILIPCGTFAPVMREGALMNGMKEEQVIMCADTLETIPVLDKHLRAGDVVFLKASEGEMIDGVLPKGVRMERVVKAFMLEPDTAPQLLCRQEPAWQRN